MGLSEYQRKRKFTQTPEPEPNTLEETVDTGKRGGYFCVQRHNASHLHYDFRLEVDGVLVSWAIPKGPSLDPARKPLSMKVEDHPLDYGNFEGNIPAGNYGGGSVMLWDTGSYDLLGDATAQEQLRRGDFKFALHGTKLNGSFAIVLMKNRGKGNEWLLIKKPDEYAVPAYDIDQFAWSVLTRRTQDEIAVNHASITAGDLNGAKRAAMPATVEPMLATAVRQPPEGAHWLYEVKWDGIRALCTIQEGKLKIESRRGNRCDQQYPELAHLPRAIAVPNAILDGEICLLDEQGRSRFELIQPRIMANPKMVPGLAESTPATLFLFDVLYADGFDVRKVPLRERQRLLEALVTTDDRIRISEAFEADGDQMLAVAQKMGLEGVVAKERESGYENSRSKAWLKIKITNEQEFVIAGYTAGEREYFGALVLGVYEDNGGLRHVGQVGTGFDQKMMKLIFDRLQPLIAKKSPFTKAPRIKGVTWLKPEAICQVRFAEWTPDGNLRAPVFLSLRDDKTASKVVREVPAEPPVPVEQSPVALPKLSAKKRAKQATKKAEKRAMAEMPKVAPALDLTGREAHIEVDGHTLRFTNLDKVFFPKDSWTKRNLLEFYNAVSPWLLPHLHGRPLSMKRYPNGINGPYFFQKDAAKGFPEWMHCEIIVENSGTKRNHYVIADNRATLLYLVNLGCIDHNAWNSRQGSLEHPDWVLIDLDPVDSSYDKIVEAALLIRGVLLDLGLAGYPKTTGGDGMHLYVPLEPIYTFEQVRSLAEIVAHIATTRNPDLFTTPRSVKKRTKGRVYFDWMQIGTGKTIAAPYVVRAYENAPVATPLAWEEVKVGLRPTDFRIDNAMKRFEKVGDLFAPVLQGGQRIEPALTRAQQLSAG